jgi:hypothetical protein
VLFSRKTTIRLSRRFRGDQALAVKTRAIEAANTSLAGREHRAGILGPVRARLFLLGGDDPVEFDLCARRA